MKVTEQIDALRALAVSPVQYLVVPRVLAAVTMVPLVYVLADAGGLIGGCLLSQSEGILPVRPPDHPERGRRRAGEPDPAGGGLGLLLTPVTVAALSSLRGAEIAQGAGLTNLFRQLGGSFGIALANTYVTGQAARYRSALVSHLYAGNPILDARVAGATARFLAGGLSLASAHDAAVAVLDRLVQRQAATLAYDDAFLLLAAVSALCIPAALLLVGRRTPAASRFGAGH